MTSRYRLLARRIILGVWLNPDSLLQADHLSKTQSSAMTYPELYHAHHTSDREDIQFWMDLAESKGGPILELGCGTGRVLVELAAQGYQTYGLDYQHSMLSNLKNHLPGGLRNALHIIQADMAAFRFAVQFPLIVLPCNTLSTLLAAQRRRTLMNVAGHLEVGGWFAASIPNPQLLAVLPETGESEVEGFFPHPVDGEPVQVSSSWKRNTDSFILHWHYDHLYPDGHVERLTVESTHLIQPVQEIRNEIEEAGLRIVGSYGSFDRAPYTSRSAYYIFIAERT